jgi:prevent-host-death family protein
MTNHNRLGVQKAREGFRTVVDDALIKGEITVVERHGKPVVAVVPYEWFERAEAALAKEGKEPE